MGTRAAVGILAVLLLAGCASDAPPALSTGPSSPAPLPTVAPSYGPATCSNLLLFQLADYAHTDPFLPPGFHPRDPQEFLSSPAALGQAGVIFMALDCDSAASGRLQVAFVGIFIEAPIVEGLEPAPLNFFELVRYNPAEEFGGALGKAGWPVVTANVTVGSQVPAAEGTDVQATVSDPEGTVALVAGSVAAFSGGLGNLSRFWHQDTEGLAYIEYAGDLSPRVGSGVCEVRHGTPLGAFVAAPVGLPVVGADPTSCIGPNGEPVAVVLEDLTLDATLRHLPGERAG